MGVSCITVSEGKLKNEGNVVLAAILFVLTFFLPFLVVSNNDEYLQSSLFFSPTWLMGWQHEKFVGGFTPMTMAYILFWIPYPIIGYFALNYSQGKYSERSSFLTRVLVLTLVVLLLTLGLTIMYFPDPLYISLPVTTIVVLIMTLFLRKIIPLFKQTPWGEESKTESKSREKRGVDRA